VAVRAKAFGMTVYGYDPFLTEERAQKLGVRMSTVEEVLKNADFITVHTPLTPETRHMIAKEQFAIAKKGVRIINCARGGIIHEKDLIEAIDAGIVAGAAFDVFEEEPPPADHPFLSHPKIIVTPHLGASTVEAQENVAIDVSEQLLHILRGEPFKNAVNMPPVPGDVLAKIEPYFPLGKKLGSFAAQIAEGPVKEIVVSYAGELADVDTAQLTRYVVQGVLAHHLGSDEVNVVNAMHLAKSRGVNIVVSATQASKGFTNLISVTLKTNKEERVVSGALLNGFGPRITQIDKFPVDVEPQGHLLLISHHDKPGIIGRVGTLLGNNDINIATMQVGRKVIGGAAIMVLGVDKGVPKQVLSELTALPDLNNAKEIQLF
jgi:D-3-phosphoglycerate dehydrogenase